MSCINALQEAGFVRIENNHNENPLFEYRDPVENFVVMQAEVDSKESTVLLFMECEVEWDWVLGSGVDYKEWLNENVQEATQSHKVARSALEVIRQHYANGAFEVHVLHNFNMSEVHVGAMDDDGIFVPIQKFNVSAYEDELRVFAYGQRRAGSRMPLYVSAADTEFAALREWLTKPHSRYKETRRSLDPIIREEDGKHLEIYTLAQASRYLPLYVGAKSVKVIRANTVISFHKDDYNLLAEMGFASEQHVFIAYEV